MPREAILLMWGTAELLQIFLHLASCSELTMKRTSVLVPSHTHIRSAWPRRHHWSRTIVGIPQFRLRSANLPYLRTDLPPESLVQQARRRMDDLVKRAIGLAEQKTKTASSVPSKADEPWKQPWHVHSASKGEWEVQETPHRRPHAVKRLVLYSWNIDFMLPFPESRMRAAIRHLQSLTQRRQSSDTASVIFLQECVSSDLTLLAQDPWIQQTFAITDVSTENWQSGHYGTTTLIDKNLAIKNVFRVHYEKTRMQRDGLFVDITLPMSSGETGTLRLCNTHLESLAFEPPFRPAQVALCADYMQKPEISFSAMAGDFNAIQDFDRTLHSDNSLEDAFLSCGGSEDDAEGGHTWGQQAATAQRERFGTSRMDKVFFCGRAMKCVGFERFGAGIEVEDSEEREAVVGLGFDKPWITDHLGVKAVFEMV